MENKKRLKIAIFDPVRMFPGGGRVVIPQNAEYLSNKHDVTLFMQKPPAEGLSIGKSKLKLIKPGNIFLAPLAFLKLNLKKEDFDILIVGCFPSHFLLLRNGKKFPSIHITNSPLRVFYDLKEHMLKNASVKRKAYIHIKNILFKKLDYLSARKADKILVVSEEVKDRVKKFYKRDSEIYRSPLNPKKFKSGKYGNYILAPTRIVSAKRPEMIVDAMNYVENKSIKLVLVGSGDLSSKIEKLAKKHKNIEFRGFVSDKELVNLYANCLAVVYIPINEDYGYVPVEAGASQKATIGVNEGGLKETIIDGKTGFLIKNITPKKLAEKIDFFANNRKAAIKMGKEARKHSAEYFAENTFPILDKAIEEVIAEHKRKMK